VLSAYIYLFIAGENLPLWVYVLVVGLIGYSAYSTVQTVRKKTSPGEEGGEAENDEASAGPPT
jgi:hypothetical protein